MASKRRIRANACEGKVRHISESHAKYACFLEKQRLGEWLIYYKCKFCRRWHIGHPPKKSVAPSTNAISALELF
ncbi:MAG TPA: hypothetical protein VEQ34_02155 [Pyrinomonadaceae bacterium]|nr:hypothetical protein [Pyrinomonadaceae bacterium]